MEYYIYVSDTKLDMLYEQIPVRTRDRLATELKIDLKLLSTTLSEQPSEKNRFTKLKLVIDFISKHESVGTVDEPKSYFKGIMPLRWGPYGIGDEQIVYFCGETDHTDLGLGGSLKHLIGTTPNSAVHSGSLTPYLVAVLVKELQLPIPRSFPQQGIWKTHLEDTDPILLRETLLEFGWDSVFDVAPQEEFDQETAEKVRLTYEAYSREERLTLQAVEGLAKRGSGPLQRLKFLAKRLLDSHDLPPEKLDWNPRKRILLGTPIYVAIE